MAAPGQGKSERDKHAEREGCGHDQVTLVERFALAVQNLLWSFPYSQLAANTNDKYCGVLISTWSYKRAARATMRIENILTVARAPDNNIHRLTT